MTPSGSSAGVDRTRLAELHAEEERRFVAEHPRSATLAQEASRSLLAGVPAKGTSDCSRAWVDRSMAAPETLKLNR